MARRWYKEMLKKEKHPGGRPEKPIDIKKVQELAACGLAEEQIALSLGINIKTLRSRKRKYTEFMDALSQGKTQGIAQVANAMYQNAMDGHFPAQKFYLCNRDKDNWQDKPEVENNVNTTIIQHLDIEKDL